MNNNNQERIYKMTSVINVANRFIELSLNDNRPITNLKLQKLVYIAYAFMLKRTFQEMFNDDICAFRHGPVIPELYSKLKHYGSNNITALIDFGQKDLPDLNDQVICLVDKIFEKTSANDLVTITHLSGSAWSNVVNNCNGKLDFLHPITKGDVLKSNEPAVQMIEEALKS
tara:strand:- start:648 stop:1160 length:513 start_codon:yes stop_codon:yes gene_type:complete